MHFSRRVAGMTSERSTSAKYEHTKDDVKQQPAKPGVAGLQLHPLSRLKCGARLSALAIALPRAHFAPTEIHALSREKARPC